jgi:transglutaminase-like putative cysteine protease
MFGIECTIFRIYAIVTSAASSPRCSGPIVKRIRIVHKTEYHYNWPVTFGPHRAMLLPREGHDVHIASSRLDVAPAADLRWLRDIYGNSIAILTFADPSRELSILSEVDVDLQYDNPIECLIEPTARSFPFQYAPEEQVDLIPYRLPSYPYDGPAVQKWLSDLYRPGQVVGTFDLLGNLNTHIHQCLKYARREDPGVQPPHETLGVGSGSCRDFAVLMMEAAPALGIRSALRHRIHPDGRRPARCHACLDRDLHPRRRWHGFDPTNNKLVGSEHVSVAVAREQENASPLAGAW